jgi:hypothetical protein
VTLIDDVTTPASQFASTCLEGVPARRIPVRNGRLQVVIGGTSGNTLINHLEAAPVPEDSVNLWSINFQPAGSSPPAGFLVDSGQVFDAGRGYGWDAAVLGRERNQPVPQVLDTFAFSSAVRTWELAVPDGDYDVWFGLGDASFAQGPHRLVVEGIPVVQNAPTAAGVFIEGKTGAHVEDGRLTIQIGQGGSANTALDYIVVESVDPDGDGFGTISDNCPHHANPSQSDFDDDGEGDVCDLNDGLIHQFRDDAVSVSWFADQGPTSWNVYVGDLGVMKGTGVYAQAPGSNALAERHCGTAATSVGNPVHPGPGQVSFSLVTGVQGGVEGSLGAATAGSRQNANPCP